MKTTEEFISASTSAHGDKYDYSKSVFSGLSKMALVTCRTHGDFNVQASAHIKGRGCAKCAGKIKKTTAEFVAGATSVHGDRYDYSRVEYKGNKTEVEVVCREHGPFFPSPLNHIKNRSGCPSCSGVAKTSADIFIDRAKAVHGDKYDYSKVEYKGVDAPILIVCPEHGEFMQIPYDHTKGHGCKACGIEKCATSNRRTIDEFIRRAREFHGNKYEYGKVEYKNSTTPVEITCPDHGSFWQIPHDHITRYGCAACSGLAPVSKDEFIERSISAHGDEYDYSNTGYDSFSKPASIRCKTHGVFWQIAKTHAAGHGCPKCAREQTSSAGENEVADWIESIGHVTTRNDRTVLDGFEIDIYIPGEKLGIEFNGAYWHSDNRMVNARTHEVKAAKADKAGIRLVSVWDFDWISKKEFIKNMILHRLGKNSGVRIDARKCLAQTVDSKVAASFYDRTHIQGAAWRAKVHIGLFYQQNMVACMSFSQGSSRRGKTGNDEWELIRFSTDGVVRGGAGKLFSAFIKSANPESVWSFSDRQHFSGGMYRSIGFVEDGVVAADYRVFHQGINTVWHKSAWQRKNIPLRLIEVGSSIEYDSETDPRTEREMQEITRCVRIMDSGKIRWKWTKKEAAQGDPFDQSITD